MHDDLLKILCCPVSHVAFRRAGTTDLAAINESIANGRVQNRGGRTLSTPLSGALITTDEMSLYPIEDGIPVLLADEGIVLGDAIRATS